MADILVETIILDKPFIMTVFIVTLTATIGYPISVTMDKDAMSL